MIFLCIFLKAEDRTEDLVIQQALFLMRLSIITQATIDDRLIE